MPSKYDALCLQPWQRKVQHDFRQCHHHWQHLNVFHVREMWTFVIILPNWTPMFESHMTGLVIKTWVIH